MSDAATEHVRQVYSVLTGGARQTPENIARSWVRCLEDYHLDPAVQKLPSVVSAAELRERSDRLGDLAAIAKVEMANLYQQLAGNQLAVMLTDADGVIISLIGDPQFTRGAARLGMREGAIWTEAEQGTNGMGTSLAEGAPVLVHRNEHFLISNTKLTCSAAPITDCSGRIAAILDVSSESPLPQQHSLVLVSMSAQMVENRAFLSRYRNDYVMRFHSRPEFVYTLSEGAIALSEDGRVLAANRSALFMLGFHTPAEVLGTELATLVKSSLPDLVSRTVRNAYHPVPIYSTRDGSRYFAVAQQPERFGVQREQPAGRTRAARAETKEAGTTDELRALDLGDPKMAFNIRCAKRVLNRDLPILLYGETGTGKERFAKAIHAASERAGGPFVPVNCAAMPDTLIESELFGYKSGAFTGAGREGRRGKIAQADGGTLFLDEIGDMPLMLQAKLLRVLEEREVIALGGETAVKVDLQVVSATHRDLGEMVAHGEFREDLFYRLQGLVLTLPPLRERQDRRALILSLLEEEAKGEDVTIDDRALELLDRYEWPGNVRQLRHVLRAAVALCSDGVVHAQDLPDSLRQGRGETAGSAPEAPAPALNALEAAERDALIQELERQHWNVSGVATRLGTSRNTLYRKMKRLGIRNPKSEGDA